MKWIRCDERLPEYRVPVLLFKGNDLDGEYSVAALYDSGGGNYWSPDGFVGGYEWEFDQDATHWMPLPSRPTEKELDNAEA